MTVGKEEVISILMEEFNMKINWEVIEESLCQKGFTFEQIRDITQAIQEGLI